MSAVADLRGGAPGTRAPLDQTFFIFMQFSGRIRQLVGWRAPFRVGAPPLGNPGSTTGLEKDYQR